MSHAHVERIITSLRLVCVCRRPEEMSDWLCGCHTGLLYRCAAWCVCAVKVCLVAITYDLALMTWLFSMNHLSSHKRLARRSKRSLTLITVSPLHLDYGASCFGIQNFAQVPKALHASNWRSESVEDHERSSPDMPLAMRKWNIHFLITNNIPLRF